MKFSALHAINTPCIGVGKEMNEKEIKAKMEKALNLAREVYINFLNKNIDTAGPDFGTVISIMAVKIFDELKNNPEKR